MSEIKHFYQDLPGWFSFRKLYMGVSHGVEDGDIIVEIGPFMGKSTAYMATQLANLGKRCQFDTIDIFGDNEYSAYTEDNPDLKKAMLELDLDHEGVLRHNLSPVSDYVNIIRSDSTDAASLYDDNSVRFLFIDGCHTYERVSSDIEAWWPKIKSGCRMTGHDWDVPGVRKAVNSFKAERSSEIHNFMAKRSSNYWLLEKKST